MSLERQHSAANHEAQETCHAHRARLTSEKYRPLCVTATRHSRSLHLRSRRVVDAGACYVVVCVASERARPR
eukprot:6595327-Alexandrium_andersonii.AAC.1